MTGLGDAMRAELAQVPPEPARRAEVVRLSDVKPEAVAWLWSGRVPRRKLTLLEGNPGEGKTWAALSLAAAITRGHSLPGGSETTPAAVIYVSFEDGLADTIRPRLDELGADCRQVHALTGWRERGKDRGPITAAELDLLAAEVDRLRPALVVVDPIQAYVGADVNMNAANEVRPVLAGLAALAERGGCAVVAVRHLRKGAAENAVYRGLGSIDFVAAARSVLLVARDPDDESECGRVLAQVKSSLGPFAESLKFSLEGGRLLWAGTSSRSAEELLAVPTSSEERDRESEAVEWLRHALSTGPRHAGELLKEARGVGLAERTVQRARARVGAISRRDGARACWVWELQGAGGEDGKAPDSPDAAPWRLGALNPGGGSDALLDARCQGATNLEEVEL